MKKFRLTLTAAAVFAVAATQAHAANIVVNGGFETGDFTSWTANTNSASPWQVDVAGSHGNNPFDGTFYASTGCLGAQCITGTTSQQASLSQDLTTVVGDSYTLDFFFGSAGDTMELQALFGGAVAEDLTGLGTTPYTEYTVSGLVATSTTTTLEFLGRQDPAWDELDDVSVVDDGAAAAPEPAAWMLGLSGLVALAGSRLRARA
jgi:hypothetical protein